MDVRETVERWREEIPRQCLVEGGASAGIIGLGIAALVLMLVRGRRGFFAIAIPGALLAAGLVMLTDVTFDVRGERIAWSRAFITSELEGLDPIARAQVLRDVVREEYGGLLPGGD
jgi:hypothetical protein